MTELKFLYSGTNQLWVVTGITKIKLFIFLYYYLDDNDEVNHIIEIKKYPNIVLELIYIKCYQNYLIHYKKLHL